MPAASLTVTVDISRQLMRDSTPRCFSWCAVSVAIRRALQSAGMCVHSVAVTPDTGTIVVSDPNRPANEYFGTWPRELQWFIRHFDSYGLANPIRCKVTLRRVREVKTLKTEPIMRKGIAYWARYEDAREVADKVGGRCVAYELGWAVQYRISGPYYPEMEGVSTAAKPDHAQDALNRLRSVCTWPLD